MSKRFTAAVNCKKIPNSNKVICKGIPRTPRDLKKKKTSEDKKEKITYRKKCAQEKKKIRSSIYTKGKFLYA